ncbi:molybdopterin-binding protein [Clostridium sp. SM-530-WT-3G]|uniref:molybdopterin-binding protein n=1 Tax=Clostridium sp. SM-530-WT-3G TaxID=2725303 RepID=UPI00145D8404|nr:molybdopterin-binding protein [Clostridium sp. SM-530-WT-3G]NME82467.1 molybdopterin-binding protein [Clostridium sp. SM-530-WT-3G]
MKQIETVNAVGHVLCHDITRIVKDVVKDTPFRKGHVVTEEDIPVLLSIGKEHLYVWEKKEGMLHEDEAAEILYDICKNDNMSGTEIKEGKIELKADIDGLFRVDVDRLNAINDLDDIMIATRHTNYAVKKGDKLAGARVIPLIIEEEKLKEAQKVAGDKPLLELLPYKKMKAGIVTTGSEVYHGRIKDTFTPVVVNKLKEYGIEVGWHKIVDDKNEMIVDAIKEIKESGADLILCTGGMSVDPDDLTPGAIKKSGANIVQYGAPVLPGAMFLLGYFEDGTPIMGLPGCVMFSRATALDLVLPRVAAGVTVTKKDINRMGHGGLCFSCKVCTYPRCEFGKGV